MLRAITIKAENHWKKNYPKVNPDEYQTNTEKIDNELKTILEKLHNKSSDRIRPTSILDHKFETKIETRENIIIPPSEENILVYTDGSKDNKENTGYGYYIENNNKNHYASESLNNYNTVYQAETIAIHEAASYLIRNNTMNTPIYFFSDSQATIRALTNHTIKSHTTLECIKILNTLGLNNKVTIKWIPGHKGYDGNEIADSLAKNGASKDSNEKPWHRIPHSLPIRKIKNYYTNNLIIRWNGTKLSKQTKILITILIGAANNDIKKLYKRVTSLNIKNIKTLIKTVTGHNNLKYHLEKTGYAYDNDCTYCSPEEKYKKYGEIYEEETALHILCDCIAFTKTRIETYGKPYIKPQELNTGNLTQTINDMIKFMQNTTALKKTPEINKNHLSPRRSIKRKRKTTKTKK